MKPRARVSALKIPAGPITRQAEIRPESLDEKTRSFDVVFSRGSAVPRRSFWTGERYVETLSLEPGAIRFGRINSGRAPFLDSHTGYKVEHVLGRVLEDSAKVVDGAAVARVALDPEDENATKLWGKIERGFVRNISVGYDVHTYERIEPNDRNEPVEFRATDWEPFEISAVPMGADDEAQIRAADREARSIPVIMRGASAPTKESVMATPKATQVRDSVEPNEDGSCPDGYEMVDGACQAVAEKTERVQGAEIERARVSGILVAAGNLGLSASSDLVRKLIADGTPLVEAQSQLIAWHGERTAGQGVPARGGRPPSARVEFDVLDKMHRGMTGALLHRIDSGTWPLEADAREYRSRSLLQLAEVCLEQRGISTRGMSKQEIAKRATEPLAIQVRAGMHTTSDFANVLADVAGKSLRRSYEAAPATWLPIARRITITDFKAVKRNQLGEAPALKKVLEHGEFTRGTIAEGKEEFSLATYGRIFAITRQALINDDLDAFGDLVRKFGQAARNLESDLVWFQIVYGKTLTMADGQAIFSTAHANFTDSGAAIAIDKLGVGRALMAKQKGLDGETFLNIKARYLMVPPDLETIAQQYTTVAQGAQILTPSAAGSVNPFAGLLQVISEPRLGGSITVDGVTATGDAFQWYLAADPGQIDMIEYGYLDGDEGPVMDARIGFDVDGVETKCRLDFAAKVIDYRGFYRNDGQ